MGGKIALTCVSEIHGDYPIVCITVNNFDVGLGMRLAPVPANDFEMPQDTKSTRRVERVVFLCLRGFCERDRLGTPHPD